MKIFRGTPVSPGGPPPVPRPSEPGPPARFAMARQVAIRVAGSWTAARAAGLVRTEGKAYVMRPSDVVEFRFNV